MDASKKSSDEELENMETVYDTETKGESDEVAPAATEASAFSKAWTRALVKVRKPISKAVVFTADTAAKSPKTTVILGIVSALVLVVIGLFTNFYVEVDGDILWTPTPSAVLTHGEWMADGSGFPSPPRWFLMAVHADGENVFSQGTQGVERVFQALDVAVNSKGYPEACKQAKVTMQDENGEITCRINSVTRFWKYTQASFETEALNGGDFLTTMSAMEYPDGTPVDQMQVLGNGDRDSDGKHIFVQE